MLGLLEPTLRSIAVELLGKAEASVNAEPGSETWWQRATEVRGAGWLVRAERISRLYEFDESFHERVTEAATSTATRVLTRIGAVVGYAVARVAQAREDAIEAVRGTGEIEPERLDWPMVAVWSSITSSSGAVYLPRPDVLGQLLDSIRPILPIARGTLATDFSQTIDMAYAIMSAAKEEPSPAAPATRHKSNRYDSNRYDSDGYDSDGYGSSGYGSSGYGYDEVSRSRADLGDRVGALFAKLIDRPDRQNSNETIT
jgi:hypothetical protein